MGILTTSFWLKIAMVDKLLGSYQFEKNENFEEFLTATGVPMIPRKMMTSTSPSINISKDGNKWTISFKVLMKSNSISFELGKEFEENNPVSGEKQKCLAEDKDGSLVITATIEKTGKSSSRTFSSTDEGFTLTLQAAGTDIVAKRFFKKTE